MTLTQLFRKYGDKLCLHGTDKETIHSYGAIYDQFCAPIKDRVTSLLEIGISGGYALLAYAEFFPNVLITGMDLVNVVNPQTRVHPRIKLVFGDANRGEIKSLVQGAYDLIIEDGSHKPDHQIKHFHDYGPMVKLGGYYIIEDVAEEHRKRVSIATRKLGKSYGFIQTFHDLRLCKGRSDDLLIVLHRVKIIDPLST